MIRIKSGFDDHNLCGSSEQGINYSRVWNGYCGCAIAKNENQFTIRVANVQSVSSRCSITKREASPGRSVVQLFKVSLYQEEFGSLPVLVYFLLIGLSDDQ